MRCLRSNRRSLKNDPEKNLEWELAWASARGKRERPKVRIPLVAREEKGQNNLAGYVMNAEDDVGSN